MPEMNKTQAKEIENLLNKYAGNYKDSKYQSRDVL